MFKRKRTYRKKPAFLNPIPIGMAFDRVDKKWEPLHSSLQITLQNGQNQPLYLQSTDAYTIARHFYSLIISRHGCPHTILSDRGSNLLSKFMTEVYAILKTKKINTSSYRPQTMLNVYAILKTKKINTSSYRPQTDGLVERFNGVFMPNRLKMVPKWWSRRSRSSS